MPQIVSVPPLLVQVEIQYSQDTRGEAKLITPISSHTDTYSVHVIQWYSSLRLKFTDSSLGSDPHQPHIHYADLTVFFHLNASFISHLLMCAVRTVLPLPPVLCHYVHNINGDHYKSNPVCRHITTVRTCCISLFITLCLSLSVCLSLPADWIESWLRVGFGFGLEFGVWLFVWLVSPVCRRLVWWQ